MDSDDESSIYEPYDKIISCINCEKSDVEGAEDTSICCSNVSCFVEHTHLILLWYD